MYVQYSGECAVQWGYQYSEVQYSGDIIGIVVTKICFWNNFKIRLMLFFNVCFFSFHEY